MRFFDRPARIFGNTGQVPLSSGGARVVQLLAERFGHILYLSTVLAAPRVTDSVEVVPSCGRTSKYHWAF